MKKILLFLALFSAVACSGMLDIPQHGNVSTLEDYYKTDEEIESAVAAVYAQFRGLHFQFFYTLTSLDDDSWTGGMTRGDNAHMEKLNEYTFDSSHEWLQTCYKNFYQIIYKASLITDNVESTSPAAQRAIQEMKVFRAYINFYLVSLWGNAPLVDHVLKPEEYRVSNSTPAEFWASIEKDLNEAINSGALPSKKNLTDRNTGIRFTKETALAILGKAYLWQGKYAEAAAAFDKVIDSGLYGLWGVAEPGEYEELLHYVADNCCESLFELQWRKDASASQGHNTLFISLALRDSYFDCTNPDLAFGWGFINPSKSLADAFLAEEGPDGYRFRSSIKDADDLAKEGLALKTVWIPGHEGFFNWKWRLTKDDLARDNPGFQMFNAHNFRILRYAEVLLCASEAHLMAGNAAKAEDYLNQVRRRAKLADKTGITLDDIKLEKRLELCIENVRYMDLVRWGDAERVLGEQGKNVPSYTFDATSGIGTINPAEYTNTVYGFKPRNKYLPIPANEISVNPNMHQNEGW